MRSCLASMSAIAPIPTADDSPPAALLKVPDSSDVAVGSIKGEPRATAAKLGAAIAKELIKHDIPASNRTTGRNSFQLDGRIEEGPPQRGKATLTVFWRLRDPAGHVVSERRDRALASVRQWESGDDNSVGALVAPAAAAFATLLTDDTPKEKPLAAGENPPGRVRVAVRKISGAPGDGDTSLAQSVAAVIKRHDLDVVDPRTGKPDLAIDAEVQVEPAKDRKQHVKIVWHVSRAAGGEVGTVAQENDIPRGRLDGPWGDVAYSVAIAAENGLMVLVGRGAPPLKVGAARSAAPPPIPPMPERPPPATTTPPPASPSAAGRSPVPSFPLDLQPPPAATPEPTMLPPLSRGVPLPSR